MKAAVDNGEETATGAVVVVKREIPADVAT